jgi:hypothetical protein
MFDGGEPAGTNGAKAEAEPAVIAEQIDPIVDAIVSGAVPNSLSSALYLGIVSAKAREYAMNCSYSSRMTRCGVNFNNPTA